MTVFWVRIGLNELCHSFYLFFYFLKNVAGNSLVVQWLGLRASTAGGMGSIPGQGAKPHSAAKKKKKKIIWFSRKFNYLGDLGG